MVYDGKVRKLLRKTLAELTIASKLINLIKVTMNEVLCKIKIQKDLSDSFRTRIGLKKGDALAPMLFNLTCERAIRKANINISKV